VAQDTDPWWAVVKTVIKVWVSQNGGIAWISVELLESEEEHCSIDMINYLFP
jgi:hypothetical protein